MQIFKLRKSFEDVEVRWTWGSSGVEVEGKCGNFVNFKPGRARLWARNVCRLMSETPNSPGTTTRFIVLTVHANSVSKRRESKALKSARLIRRKNGFPVHEIMLKMPLTPRTSRDTCSCSGSATSTEFGNVHRRTGWSITVTAVVGLQIQVDVQQVDAQAHLPRTGVLHGVGG